jgi:hypothetical protein
MRKILKARGFKLEAGWWWRDGKRYYEDEHVEKHHTDILRRWFVGEGARVVEKFFDSFM